MENLTRHQWKSEPFLAGNNLTNSQAEPVEAGKGGEGGDFLITNVDFIAAVFPHITDGAYAAVCSKTGDPSVGGWFAKRADKFADTLSSEHNNYLACASYYLGDDGSFKIRKSVSLPAIS